MGRVIETVINLDGEIVETYDYGPYGELLSENNCGIMFLYNGELGVATDSNGLYYMRARYYNPEIKRFINQDVMTGSITNSPTLNRYAYVNGNPISLNDPFGLSPMLKWLGHTALDILGTIPIVGIVFDGVNAWWYFKDKDYFNAACSAVAALPGIGDFIAVTGKGGNIGCQLIKGFKLAEQGTNMMQSAYGGATSLSNMIDAWGDGKEASGWDKLGLVVSGLSFRNSAKGFKNAEASSYCFIAGTLITTSDGFKTIEEIQVGDEVLSENELTGEVEVKKVTQTFVNETNELVHIHVNGEEIVATPSHPFYVYKFGWTLAGSLKAGDVLVLSNGELVTVEWVQHEILEAPIKVYNFEVEDFHTYFVGENSVLVHNSCRNPNGRKGGTEHQQKTQEIKDNIKTRNNSYTDKEMMFDTTGGHKNKRFADVVELDDNKNVVAIYQVGKVNKNGLPVSRESKAIEDIMNSKDYNGAPIYFIPYNSDIGPIIYMY